MAINLNLLHAYIADYKQLITTPDYDELYKWEAARKFQDNWNERARNVANMLDRCLSARWNNLWAGNQFFLKKMLLELARHDGKKVLSLFKLLFDETQELEERALTFREEMGALGEKAFPGRSAFQDDRAIMLYLGLRFPDKYPLYKFEMFKDFARLVAFDGVVKKSSPTNRFRPVRQYLELAALVRTELEKDADLLAIHRKMLDPDIHFTGEYGALLTQDFMYCTAEEHPNNAVNMVEEEAAHYETGRKRTGAKPYAKSDALKDLFMSEEAFDRIARALKHKKNIVLQGAPGVGKTFVAKRLAYYLTGSEDPAKVRTVQFHQSFGYEEFIMGIRPDAAGKFRRKKGILYEFCEHAQDDPEHDYFLIIDEINRGNLSKIFGELMLLIEADKRGEAYQMPLLYSEGAETFYLPENLYFIGTMNTADRSLALVDYALRRRFAFIDLAPEFGARFEAHLLEKGVPAALISSIIEKVQRVNRIIEDDPNLGKGFLIGHSYFCQLENLADWASPEDWYNSIVEWEIAPQLREYWFDNTDKVNELIGGLIFFTT
ncbi:MAG: AAA family ATPase [Saprospiraceae bacterium]